MLFLYFVGLIASEELPNYRTKFYTKIPTNFDPKIYDSNFTQNLGNIVYRCFQRSNQTPHTDSTPEEYLKASLSGSCFEYTHTNYWFFRFCPFKSLTQFRYAENNVTRIDIFNLGIDTNQTFDKIHRGFGANWTGGDICVINKKPRTSRIEYICDMSLDSDGNVTSISEPAFCTYLARFHTPLACGFPGVTDENLTTIDCFQEKSFSNSYSLLK
ncbi:hypothetical protein TRFO_34569 [Tritrichomonas foetus]|uniref:MRH domain-containing protein n=1 Tax=Tritrichomonas foetus TaxID=1144522 RepID=A0A1J4JIW1_9EUKA|nr:hypothetical protein TRFO_34569 [Tritrichomonas foetus]|eukprot:OHS99082.1 hypothetical protein TRFO_34569 [Tritrichomonas foetus]